MSKRAIREKIKTQAVSAERARKDAVHSEVLRTETSGYIETDPDERTYEITQEQVKRHVSIKAAEQSFELDVENGPIYAKYSRNGVYMFLRNGFGYLASFDTKSTNLHFEIDVRERVHDAVYLHNERFIAVAQENNVFIYNGDGVEVHCVRENNKVFKMEYLPHHYILTTMSRNGFLRYQDVSTGKIVSEVYMKDTNATTMKQNSRDAIIYTGNVKGIVSLWSPNSKDYLVKILCHKSCVSSIEIDRSGNYMVSVGMDNMTNVWDLRNTYNKLRGIKLAFCASTTSMSQNGMVAVGFSDRVHVLKDLFGTKHSESLYMRHRMCGRRISSLDFCNYEDILCIGHEDGISNIIIPGSGDPVYDSYEESPFASRNMKREREVRCLLEKIPYELISMGTNVGSVYEENRTDVENAEFGGNIDENLIKKKRGALHRFYNNVH